MKMPAIHHVQMAIPNGGEQEARHFYGDLLGLPEVSKPPNLQRRGGVWFDTGTIQLHLGVDPSFTPAAKAHVAFECPDLRALRERLDLLAYPIVDDEPLPGYDRFYTSDPFGNRIELLSPVKSSASMDDGS